MKKPWNTDALVDRFETHRDQELAAAMAAYMKNKFPFLGIKNLSALF